jgi:hypothetical protein
MNHTNELQNHPLLGVLRSRNVPLADQAMRLIRGSQRFLEYTVSTFPGGTDHTSRHTTTVERIASMVLSDAFLAALGDYELFFLAVACHYHDLAMAGTEADDRTPETREQVRRDHAIRIGTTVREKWAELGFEDERTAQVLGEVCRGHRPQKNSEGEANWDELNSVEVLGPGVSVRVRLLSALTYAIDELHLGADRAPARVQSWRNICEEESRRHWRRHQAVNGPCLTVSKSILFQVNADTPGFEENLRAQVFHKALAAVRDLRRQADAEGVAVPLPEVEVQWNRHTIWETLLPLVCSDLRPRPKEETVQALLDRLAELSDRRTDLTSLCAECGNTEAELLAGACRCVEDAITRRHLVESPTTLGGLSLSTAESVADDFFSRMRTADELDRLFLGRYRARWEEELFESAFGRDYVVSCVLPAVERSYSVRLTQRPETDPLRAILGTCPTAARLVQAYGPTPSNLVKEPLLTHATITGALFDLHSDPGRLLDRRLRDALRTLTGPDHPLGPTLRLLEEMALVGGFSAEQVHEAHTISEATRRMLDASMPANQPVTHIGLAQSLPRDAPSATTHLPYLLLASRRAGTPVHLTNAPGQTLDLQVTPEAALPVPVSDEFVVGVGPAEAVHNGPTQLPARIEVDRPSRTIRFYLGRFGNGGPTQYPVVVTVPPSPRPGERPRVDFGTFIQWPELTVRDLRSLDAANQVIRRDRGCVEFIVEDDRALLASMNTPGGGDMFRLGPWTNEVLRGIADLDENLPVPHFIPVELLGDLGGIPASDRNAAFQRIREAPPGGPVRKSSMFLRITTDTGKPIDERFLGFFQFNLFPAPTVGSNERISQQDLARSWEAAEEDFVIVTYFQADVQVLSEALREWCRSRSGEFPFRFDSNAVNSPSTRTALTIRFLRARDRIWHLDRPIIFEFRPVNRAEAYGLEAAYWRSVNDERRAELAEEIRDRVATLSASASAPELMGQR